MVRYTSVLHPASSNLLPPRKEVLVVNSTFLFYYGYNGLTERFHSRGSIYANLSEQKKRLHKKRVLNCLWICLGNQHGHFIVLGHQDGRRDVM